MKQHILEEIIEKINSGAPPTHLSEFKKFDKKFYENLIFSIVGLHFEEREAHIRWEELLKHKYFMSEKLGYNVGIQVAALDYFFNYLKVLKNPIIMERKSFEKTETRAKFDQLTKVYNRQFLMYKLRTLVKKGNQFCILFFDIDNFKIYNDKNGHLAGDVALMEVTRIVRLLIDKGEFIGRWGGEEFIVAFPKNTKDQTLKKALRLKQYIEDFPIANEAVLPNGELTVSGGIACFPSEGGDIEKIIAVADKRLYSAKTLGKNRIIHEDSD